jgi:ATP-dependent DNA helicase RecG
LGKSRRKIYEVLVGDASGRVSCKYFRVPYRGYFERFQPHQTVRINGRVTQYRGHLEFHHPDIHPEGASEVSEDVILPIYPETEGLSTVKLRKIIETALEHVEEIKEDLETLPSWLRQKYNLIDRRAALRSLHQPKLENAEELLRFRAPSQRRIIFEEFFWLELLIASRKRGIEKESAHTLVSDRRLCHQLIQSLEFELTEGQKTTFEEIVADLGKPHPMHRLVQGDVGSGKTIVALLAACYAAEVKAQTALMVPTEILAEQHYQNSKARLEPLGLRVGLLIGSMKAAEKRAVCDDIAAGRIDICVGTHALIQESVAFQNLGLAIIDEQHRFGVAQRQLLKMKGISPHFLVMTATPIPRTLAMTVYGDLDVSILKDRPAGRQPIVTRKVFSNKMAQVFDFIETHLKNGRQAYIVYPLIEESETLTLKNAQEELTAIQARFAKFRVGLLHGRMKTDEKDSIMRQFRAHELDILVATTVIEVGVDVPNATMMVIENAERFGLSQLHQLRGRVGRGSHKSYCILVMGYAVGEDAIQRAAIMEKTSDGFVIAEEDLNLRGPGEFLGTRQSGLAGFKLANLVRDLDLLQSARQAAFEVLRLDPDLVRPEHQNLRVYLERKEAQFVA